mgnify:CR=1 FL=1
MKMSYIDASSVSATISSATGGNFEALAINPAAATTSVTDTVNTTTLSLTATPSVAEGGSIVYTASLTNAAQTAVTVDLSNGATITIAAGASSGTVSVAAPGEDVYVDASSVSATISGASGGNFEALTVSPGRGDDERHRHDQHDHAEPHRRGDRHRGRQRQLHGVADQRGADRGHGEPELQRHGVQRRRLHRRGRSHHSAGASSATFSIATIDDALANSGETLVVSVASTTGGNFESLVVSGSANSVTTTINDEATPDTVLVSLSGPGTVAEGATTTAYTVTLGQAAVTAVTVNLTYGGTATGGGTDYTGVVSVTIPAGATSATFTLPTTNDVIDEADETVVVSLGGISGGGFEAIAANPAAASVTTTITDNDATPSLVINDVSVNEAAGTATFTVTLSAASGQTVTVNYATGGGTATAGSDYTATSGTLTFTPGVVTQTITVPITNDTATESSETFNVTLSGAVNASITDNTGVGTIIDNDAPPVLDLDANNSSGAAGANYAASYTEQGAAVAIADADISITDVDSANLAGATDHPHQPPERRRAQPARPAPGITASVSSTATQITITLSGSATLAQYQTRDQRHHVRSGRRRRARHHRTHGDRERHRRHLVEQRGDQHDRGGGGQRCAGEHRAGRADHCGGHQQGDHRPRDHRRRRQLELDDRDADGHQRHAHRHRGGATIGNSGTATVTLTGTQAQINATLASNVTYVPTANFNGAATLTMTTSDGGNIGTGGTLTDVDTVGITVTAVNDAPVNTVPASIAVTEDVASPITRHQHQRRRRGRRARSVSRSSVPAGTLAATSGAGVTVTGSGSGSLVLSRHASRDQQLHRRQRGDLHHRRQRQRQRSR